MMLPPGPRTPRLLQGLGWWHRPTAYMERCRARYGKRFTIRLPGQPPFVMISEPEQLRELFTAPPEVLHPGEGGYDAALAEWDLQQNPDREAVVSTPSGRQPRAATWAWRRPPNPGGCRVRPRARPRVRLRAKLPLA